MRQLILSIAALLAFSLNACSQPNKEEKSMKKEDAKTVLVAYFSATGITAEAAGLLAKAADADLYEIVPEAEYATADLDWHDKKSRSTLEMADEACRPGIKGVVADVSRYETVYLGFPIWWYTAPRVINTFLEKNDLAGKRIILFATSGGSTTSRAVRELRDTYPRLTFEDGGLLNDRTPQEAEALVAKTR